MVQVVSAGHCTVDHIGVVGRYPALDRKEELEAFSVQGGGPAATAAVTLATLGVETAFVGKVSDDDFGRFARTSLEAAGVDCSALVIQPGRVSPLSFVAVERESGKRTVFWTRGDVARLEPQEVDLGVLDGARVLLVDGHQPEAQLRLALEARKRGLEVVVDAGARHDGLEALVKVATTVIASERFAAELAGAPDRAVQAILDLGPRAVVITLGEDGSVGREGSRSEVVAPYPVEVVDTTGAGDVFHGAYVYAWLAGWELRRRMEFASAAAALKCRQLGGRAGIPSLSDIDAVVG